MGEQLPRPRLPGVLEGTLRAVLRAEARPRNPQLCRNLSGLSTTQPPPGLTGSMEMGPWWDPEASDRISVAEPLKI